MNLRIINSTDSDQLTKSNEKVYERERDLISRQQLETRGEYVCAVKVTIDFIIWYKGG